MADVIIAVYSTGEPSALLGSYSDFADVAHPGSGNKTTGWKWGPGHWDFEFEEEPPGLAPALFDPLTSVLTDRFWQSGIGGGDDLALKRIERQAASLGGIAGPWAPILLHGSFFFRNREGYLFSDGFRSVVLSASSLLPGSTTLNQILLDQLPKPGVSMELRRFQWNRDLGRYDIALRIRKRGNLTSNSGASTRGTGGEILPANVATTEDEFVVDGSYGATALPAGNVAVAVTSGLYALERGREITDPANLSGLEEIGESDGRDDQQFRTTYSPIDSTSAIHIYSYNDADGSGFRTWTVVTTAPDAANEVQVDYVLGILRFGSLANGARPALGHTIGVHYTSTLLLEFEPEGTGDTVTAVEDSANSNPVHRVSNKGFVFLRDRELNPGNLILTAAAPLLDTNLYGPIPMGSSFVQLNAILRAEFTNELLEGETINFELLEPVGEEEIGTYSTGTMEASSITDRTGTAHAFYVPPSSPIRIGRLATSVVAGPPGQLVVPGGISAEVAEISIFKVFDDDPSMGVPFGTAAEQETFWLDFFSSEGIEGILGPADDEIGALNGAWEYRHRLLRGLLIPTDYNIEFRNGRKQMVVVWDANAINPHTGASGAYVPLRPSSMSFDGTNTTLNFTGVALDPIAGDLVDYLVAAPPLAIARASVFSSRLGRRIHSNEITLRVSIPPHMNGTYIVQDLNSIPTGLVPWTPLAGHVGRVIPFGWRLPSSGITISAAIGGLTFLDNNRSTGVFAGGFQVGST